MPLTTSEIEEQALDWVIRLRAPDFGDWDAFEAWMAADPRHADVYHELAIADQDMAAILATPEPRPLIVEAPRRSSFTHRAWIGGALAASLAAVIGFQFVEREPATYRIETKPGERRVVQLSEGSSVTLNGGTRITLDRGNSRHIELEQGEAVFAVVHNEAKPFRVIVADATLLDVGTRFNVVRDKGVTSVQVAEGAVLYNPDREKVRLDPGQTLRVADGAPAVTLGRIAPAQVAGWQAGQLIYERRPLTEVADDLARWSGQPVRVAPAIAARPFSGSLDLKSAKDIAGLAPVLDVRAERDGAGWALLPTR